MRFPVTFLASLALSVSSDFLALEDLIAALAVAARQVS